MEENIETNVEVKPKTALETLKSWIFTRAFLGTFLGALGGFLYYYFVGCSTGSCGITSNPYMSTIWGGFFGYFILNSPCARGRC